LIWFEEFAVPDEINSEWLEVIGKSLAFLCVQEIARNDPKRVPDLIAKVKFLEGIGLSTKDAAALMGTTANSVKTNQRAREKKGNGSAKKGKK
jgi:hypothetical protein